MQLDLIRRLFAARREAFSQAPGEDYSPYENATSAGAVDLRPRGRAIERGLVELQRFQSSAAGPISNLNELLNAYETDTSVDEFQRGQRHSLVASFREAVSRLAAPQSRVHEREDSVWNLINALGRNEISAAFQALRRVVEIDNSWAHGSGGLDEAARQIGQLLAEHTDDAGLRREISAFIPQISNRADVAELRREVISPQMAVTVGTTLVTGGVAGAVGGAVEGSLLRNLGYEVFQRMGIRQLLQGGGRELLTRGLARMAGTLSNAFTFNALHGTASRERTRQTSEDVTLMQAINWTLAPWTQRLSAPLRAATSLPLGGIVLTAATSLRAGFEHALGWSPESLWEHWTPRNLASNTVLHGGLTAGHAVVRPIFAAPRAEGRVVEESIVDVARGLTEGISRQAVPIAGAIGLGALSYAYPQATLQMLGMAAPVLGMALVREGSNRGRSEAGLGGTTAPPGMVRIPGGEFYMGAMAQAESQPIRLVRVSDFYMGQDPVTNGEYRAFLSEPEQRSRPFAVVGRNKGTGFTEVVERGASEAELQGRLVPANLAPNQHRIVARDAETGLWRCLDQDADRLKLMRRRQNGSYADLGIQASSLEILLSAQEAPHESEQIVRVVSEWNPAAGPEHPAVNVNYWEALGYANARGWRLPTEAEWEYSARGPLVNLREQMRIEKVQIRSFAYWVDGGTSKAPGSGRYENFIANNRLFTDPKDQELQRLLRTRAPIWGSRVYPTEDGRYNDAAIWSSLNESKNGTRAVSEGVINPNGLRDMGGNVWEWVGDYWDRYNYEPLGNENPTGPNAGVTCVLRGASWNSTDPEYLRAAGRSYDPPYARDNNIGFRVVAQDSLDK